MCLFSGKRANPCKISEQLLARTKWVTARVFPPSHLVLVELRSEPPGCTPGRPLGVELGPRGWEPDPQPPSPGGLGRPRQHRGPSRTLCPPLGPGMASGIGQKKNKERLSPNG